MLKNEDRIFNNLYGFESSNLANAKKEVIGLIQKIF